MASKGAGAKPGASAGAGGGSAASAVMAEQLWFRHESRCWALGSVKQSLGLKVELSEVSHGAGAVVVAGTLHTVLRAETQPCDMSHLTNVEDLATMNNLHEAPLLALLERRYMADEICACCCCAPACA